MLADEAVICRHPDSRVRKIAAWTLETLAAEQSNKVRMLQSGALERTLALFRVICSPRILILILVAPPFHETCQNQVRNVEMRRAAASCMAKLTDL